MALRLTAFDSAALRRRSRSLSAADPECPSISVVRRGHDSQVAIIREIASPSRETQTLTIPFTQDVELEFAKEAMTNLSNLRCVLS